MKRCPTCEFIYLDTDATCDLDGARLVAMTDAELEATANLAAGDPKLPVRAVSERRSPEKPKRRAALVTTSVCGLTLIIFLFVVYSRNQPGTKPPQQPRTENVPAQSISPAATALSDTPSTLPSASLTAEQPATASTSSTVAANRSPDESSSERRVPMSVNPVSTGGHGTIATKANQSARPKRETKPGSITIRLTNGVQLQADEVWRAKEGIWYRSKGLVTLLKKNRVRAIEHR